MYKHFAFVSKSSTVFFCIFLLLFIFFCSSSPHSANNNNNKYMVNAMIIKDEYQYFDATDFSVVAPAAGSYYKGEYCVGVNSSLGCGFEDPVGKLSTTGYVQVNFPTPVTNMYYLRIRAFSPPRRSTTPCASIRASPAFSSRGST